MRRIMLALSMLVVTTAVASPQTPRDPIPPAQKNAARIAQLQKAANEYNRAGDFERTMDALEEITRLDPRNAEAFHRVVVFYWEKAFRDHTLAPSMKREYIQRGIHYADGALGINPDYVDALTYKNILLRMLANEEQNPEEQKRLIAEADVLRNRAMEINKQRQQQVGNANTGQAGAPPPPPPPPAPPRPGSTAGDDPAPQAPVRVGGNIRTPVKVKHANPEYPAEAQAARVQGVVICEATIGTDGRVTDAKVLRSIPLLDAAALDAVRQWEFEPTYLNGVAVPVIMTVTVNFTLQ